jgi:hypothetical protein
MKRLLIAALSLALAMPAMAQQVSPSHLQAQLNQAMCVQDWSSAIANIDALLGVGLDSASTQNLSTLRSQVVEIQSSGQTFDSMPSWNCGGSSLNWERAAGATRTRSGDTTGVIRRDQYGGSSIGGNSSGGSSSGGSGSSGSGRCQVRTDIAADGSICGERAASER